MSCGRCAHPLMGPVLNSAHFMVLNDKAKYKLKRRPYPEVHIPSLLVIFIMSEKQHQLKTPFQEKSFVGKQVEGTPVVFHCLFSHFSTPPVIVCILGRLLREMDQNWPWLKIMLKKKIVFNLDWSGSPHTPLAFSLEPALCKQKGKAAGRDTHWFPSLPTKKV